MVAMPFSTKQEFITNGLFHQVKKESKALATAQAGKEVSQKLPSATRFTAASDKYSFISGEARSPKGLLKAIPNEMKAGADLYRGLRIFDLEDIQNILTTGLKVSQTRSSLKRNYLSSDISSAVLYSMQNPHIWSDFRQYDKESADQHAIPVIVGMKQTDKINVSSQGDEQVGITSQDIPASELSFVAAYMTINGNTGWYKLAIDNGEMVAMPFSTKQEFITNGLWHQVQDGGALAAQHSSKEKTFQSISKTVSNFFKKNKLASFVLMALGLGFLDALLSGTGLLTMAIVPFGFTGLDEEGLDILKEEQAVKSAYATTFNQDLQRHLANRAAGIEEAKEAPLSFDEVAPAPIPQPVLLQKKAHVFRAPIEKVGGVGAFVNWLTRLHPNRANKTVAVPTAARNTTSTVYINAPMQNLKDAPEILDMPNTKEALLATYAKNLPKGISPNVAKQTVILNFSDLHGLPATSVIQILEAHWDAFGRENVIVVSGGDIATGGYILNEHSELGAYILSHTDAALYGNHEFDMANDYVANLLTLKSFGLWSTNMAESKVGSGPAILGNQVRMFKGVIDTLPFTVKTTINKERVMVVGLPKAGYGNVFYTQPEQAHASVKETLDVAIAYAKQHPVDHIIIVAHEALNDHRADTRSKEIASALAAAPENIRKIVRVVYEGHSHKPQMWVSDTDNILHTQGSAKGEATNGIVGTVLYRVPGRATYVSTQLWNSTDGAMQAPVPGTAAHIYNTIEKQLENMHGGLDKPFALFTEPLARFKDEPNKGSAENGYINYHDNSASNFMADAERNAIKQKIRISPMTGVAELMDHGLGSAPVAIDKYQVIGAASKDNSGKVPYKGAMTLRLLSEHFPNPEPTSLARTTGLGFIELVKNNISIIDGKIVPTFYFSHNVRIAYDVEIGTRQVKKIVKEKVNGKEVAVEKEVSETYPVVHDVHVYMLGYDDKYTPIDEEGIYYLAMPDHMRVGWYEGKDIPFFLDKNPVYIEGLDRMSTTMQKFMQSAPVQLAQKIRLHPPHWYENQLAPVRPMVSDVDNPMNLPVFAPRYGRMLDLRSLPFIPTKEQLDALYAGELEYGDVFGDEDVGPISALPHLNLGGTPAGASAGVSASATQLTELVFKIRYLLMDPSIPTNQLERLVQIFQFLRRYANSVSQSQLNEFRKYVQQITATSKKPHAVMWLGPGFAFNDLEMAMSSYAGAFNMVIRANRQLQDIFQAIKPKQENTLILYGHGAIDQWPSVEQRTWLSVMGKDSIVSLEDLLRGLAKTKSSFTNIVLPTCLTGQVVEDWARISREHPELTRNVAIFTLGSRYLNTHPMYFRAGSYLNSAQGSIMRAWFNMLAANGDGIANRVIANGKVIEPLKLAIKKANEMISSASAEEVQQLTNLRDEIVSLKKIADASNPRELYKALLNHERAYPGKVDNLHKWMPVIGNQIMDTNQRPFSFGRLPQSFTWGIERWAVEIPVPFVHLDRNTVDFISQVALEAYEAALPLNATSDKKRQR